MGLVYEPENRSGRGLERGRVSELFQSKGGEQFQRMEEAATQSASPKLGSSLHVAYELCFHSSNDPIENRTPIPKSLHSHSTLPNCESTPLYRTVTMGSDFSKTVRGRHDGASVVLIEILVSLAR